MDDGEETDGLPVHRQAVAEILFRIGACSRNDGIFRNTDHFGSERRNMKDQTKQSARDHLAFKALSALAKSKMPFSVVNENGYAPIRNKPIIFAANHTNCFDIPNSSKACRRRLVPLLGKQRLELADRVFFRLNGVVYVDRLDKKSAAKVKKRLVLRLKRRTPLLWFPEGTWNLTDNLLMLPMKWGIIDIAAKAGAQIIPMALDYDRESMVCRVRFGAPLHGEALEDKAEGIRLLRDSMASLRYEQLCTQPVLSRQTADLAKLKHYIDMAVPEYPKLQPEVEASVIFWPYEIKGVRNGKQIHYRL